MLNGQVVSETGLVYRRYTYKKGIVWKILYDVGLWVNVEELRAKGQNLPTFEDLEELYAKTPYAKS